MTAPFPVLGVKSVEVRNEGLNAAAVTVCWSQENGRLYIHLGGAHDQPALVKPHQSAVVEVITIPK